MYRFLGHQHTISRCMSAACYLHFFGWTKTRNSKENFEFWFAFYDFSFDFLYVRNCVLLCFFIHLRILDSIYFIRTFESHNYILRLLFEVISSFPKIEGKVKSVMACDQRMSNKKGFYNGCRKERIDKMFHNMIFIQYVYVFAVLAFVQKISLNQFLQDAWNLLKFYAIPEIHGILLLRDCTANGIKFSPLRCIHDSIRIAVIVIAFNDTGFRVPLAFWVQVEKLFEEL